MIEMIAQCRGAYITVKWRDSLESGYQPVYLDGETRIKWDVGVWNRLFSVLQLNLEIETCRFLICSDRPVASEELPCAKNLSPWDQAALSRSAAAVERDAYPSQWMINGEKLVGKFEKSFPTSNSPTSKVEYLYTVPYLPVKMKERVTPDVIGAIRSVAAG